MAWKLELEFNDTMCCKLYSQLSFSDEDNDPTAPPASPVEGFKYAPLIKSHELRANESTLDVMDNLSEDFRNQKSNYEGSNLIDKRFINANEMDEVPGARPSLPLKYIKRCNKEKLRSIEDSHARKSYSGGSIFLKNGVHDANEDRELKMSNSTSMDRGPKKTIRKSRKSGESNDSCKSCEDDVQNKSKEFLQSNTDDINDDKSIDFQRKVCSSNCKHSNKISKFTSTKTDRAGSISKDTVSLNEEKEILSKLWEHALLATRSSSNSSLTNDFTRQNRQTNYARYDSGEHTFLNTFSKSNRVARSFNSNKVFNLTTRLRNSPHLYESRLSIVS